MDWFQVKQGVQATTAGGIAFTAVAGVAGLDISTVLPLSVAGFASGYALHRWVNADHNLREGPTNG